MQAQKVKSGIWDVVQVEIFLRDELEMTQNKTVVVYFKMFSHGS
jgi:hypothetical protein